MTVQDRGYQYQAGIQFNSTGDGCKRNCMYEGFQNRLNKYWYPRMAILNVGNHTTKFTLCLKMLVTGQDRGHQYQAGIQFNSTGDGCKRNCM